MLPDRGAREPADAASASTSHNTRSLFRRAEPSFQVAHTPRQQGSELLFVDFDSQIREKKLKNKGHVGRQLRAHVMFVSHENKMRQRVKDRERSEKGARISHQPHTGDEVVFVGPPSENLLEISGSFPDPFDALPVKAKEYPGMHDVIRYYFNNYPGCTPLTDDKILISPDESERRNARLHNTLWGIMSSEETSMLLFLSETTLIHDTSIHKQKPRVEYYARRQRCLKAVQENMPICKPRGRAVVTDGYINTIAGLAAMAAMYEDWPAANLHLNALHRLVIAAGGLERFRPLVRRSLKWCEYHVCAPQMSVPRVSTLTGLSAATTAAIQHHQYSNLPRDFVARADAAHRALATHLPHVAAQDDDSSTLGAVLRSLHLVSLAHTPAWRHLLAAHAAKDALAGVLDDAEHALLTLLVRLESRPRAPGRRQDGRRDVGGSRDMAGGGDVQRVVVAHAAHAYLWAALSDLPAGASMSVVFVERLRETLEQCAAGDARPPPPDGGALLAAWLRGGAGAEALLWALGAGLYLAAKTGARTTTTAAAAAAVARRKKGGGDVGARSRADAAMEWFEDRVLETLAVLGSAAEGVVGRTLQHFPATEEFRRGGLAPLLWDGITTESRCWDRCG